VIATHFLDARDVGSEQDWEKLESGASLIISRCIMQLIAAEIQQTQDSPGVAETLSDLAYSLNQKQLQQLHEILCHLQQQPQHIECIFHIQNL
jgi:hypothetical protein